MTTRHSNILLRKAREARQWNQADVAEKLGVATLTVGRWERGDVLPTRHYQTELFHLFGLPPQALGFLPREESWETSEEKRFIVDPMIPCAQSLIGQDELVTLLNDQIQQNHSLALYGLPGIGKTAIASVLAQKQNLFDGALWVGLGPHPTHDRHLARWEMLLGSDPHVVRSLLERSIALRMAIGMHRMLLIIDDVWSVEDAFLFKVGGPHCVYIFTTRFPNIAAQCAPRTFAVQELSEQESMNVLTSFAPGIKRSDPDVKFLIHAIHGLPLALSLIGRYLRSQGGHQHHSRRIQNTLTRLQCAEERLCLSQPCSPLEHSGRLSFPSLQAAIELSVLHLTKEAQRALESLSVFPAKPNSFSEEAALFVADTSPGIVDHLIDMGLLENREANRYCLHPVIADYARSKQTDEKAEERFVTYYARYVEKYTTTYQEIECESGNVFVMLDCASRMGMKEDLICSVCAFVPFLFLRGLYALAECHLLSAYETAQGNIEAKLPLLFLLGQVAQKQGHCPQSVALFQQGLALARYTKSVVWICTFLAELGWVIGTQGRSPLAKAYLSEGLKLAYQTKDDERICKFLRLFGSVLSSLGDYSQAQEAFQQGLVLARQSTNREQLCALLIHLSVSIQEHGDNKQAQEALNEGSVLAREIGNCAWRRLALLNLPESVFVSQRYNEGERFRFGSSNRLS